MIELELCEVRPNVLKTLPLIKSDKMADVVFFSLLSVAVMALAG